MKDNIGVLTSGLSALNLLRDEERAGLCKGHFKVWFIVLLLAVFIAGCGGSGSSGSDQNPNLDSTVPANLATGVALDLNITATFDSAIDPETITTTTFTVTAGPDLTPVAGTVGLSANGLTAVFIPTGNLSAGTTFTVTLTAEVRGLNGEALGDDKVWSFTTGTTLSPKVVSTDPVDFATGVALDKIISAEFSVAMDPETITSKTFTLHAGSKSVEGTVALSADGLTATFTPTKGLAPDTQFLARATTGVKDLLGNAMKADKLWVFQTGQ